MKKAKRLLTELTIIEFIVIVLIALAIRTHDQLMSIDTSMFELKQDLKSIELVTKTPILVGDRLDIVKDDGPIVIVKSRRGSKEYRIEKTYLQKKGTND